jgi:hypothetical protein
VQLQREEEYKDPDRANRPLPRMLLELLFSIYFPFLLVSMDETKGGVAWSTKLLIFYKSHQASSGRPMEDYRSDIITFLLIWVSAVLIFCCVHLLGKLGIGKGFFFAVSGTVALAGYPLFLVYPSHRQLPFMYVELGITLVCGALAAMRIWPVSTPLSILLLLMHYALWSSIGGGHRSVGGWYLLWPSYQNRQILQYAWIVYPVFGLGISLLCGVCIKDSAARVPLSSAAVG